MTLDRSLKSKSALTRSRNVLTRAERIAFLKEQERWDEGMTVFGLPKVARKKRRVAPKKSESAEETPAEGAEASAEKPAGS